MEQPGVVLQALGQVPRVEPVTVEGPGEGEVLVRMVASGICHTDIGYMEYARACPVLLGHEGAGVVEEIGRGVTQVAPGDHVVINWQAKCGRCRHCLRGRRDLCENVLGTAAPRLFWRGEPLNVMLNAGTFCPLVVIPAGGAIPIRKDMPLAKAALLGCAVATGVGAALYTAQVQPGERVVVLGVGGVGLNVVQGARLANAQTIIAVDLNDERLTLARKLGATHTVNSQERESIQTILDLTDGQGVDHVFEVVGHPALMRQGIDMLGRGGMLTLIGAAARDAVLSFHPRRFMSRQQQMVGCIYGNIIPERDLPLFADWYMDGRLLLDDLHTETVTLGEVPHLFEHHQEQSGIRSVIAFDGV